MKRPTLGFCAAAGVVLLVACGGSSTAGNSTPTPSSAATAKASPSQSAAPTAIDPCQVVTSAEATALAGATFGAGQEETDSGGGKRCVYGSQTLNVFTVIVAQAADPATAQADWAQEEAKVQAALNQVAQGVSFTFTINDVSNVAGADRAAVGSGSVTLSGQTISAAVIFVLKGANFFSFSDIAVGHAPPSAAAMEAQAVTSLGRV
jgi:hypothetical protein